MEFAELDRTWIMMWLYIVTFTLHKAAISIRKAGKCQRRTTLPSCRIGEAQSGSRQGDESIQTDNVVCPAPWADLAHGRRGVLLGKSVDKGTTGCGQERSGAFCDWGSGLYEPVFGAIGAVVGGIVGALLPHD